MTATAHIPDTNADFIRLGSGTPGARQVALVPGVELPLFTLDLPKGLRGQAREQVALRQLADRVGLREGTVEMRPFMAGAKPDNWTRVLISDPDRMAQWRAVQCRAVLPDYLSLPSADGVWTVQGEMVDGTELIMVRLGPPDGFSAVPDIALRLLRQALNGPKPRAILQLGDPLPGLADLAAEHAVPLVDKVEDIGGIGLPLPQVLAHDELSCDLRNDPMAARARLARQVLPWRWPLLIGAVAAALWAAAQIVAIERIEARIAGITAQTETLIRQNFVKSGPILDVRTQVSRALAEARRAAQSEGGETDPLDLTRRAAEVVAAARAEPETIRFTPGEGLSLILRLADFAAAEQITAALIAEGMDATLVESRVSDGNSGVRTEIRIADKEVTQ
ncbi:type II secretion system protein GspL [Thalassovita sp.]|uniref:type II secretion system protein GspL n=1 Tax=Thalassovita sp. TaxID=1979401 RepID=UPI002B26FCAC|nr:type II secretion system protein GspL [Thalassovita sp.]